MTLIFLDASHFPNKKNTSIMSIKSLPASDLRLVFIAVAENFGDQDEAIIEVEHVIHDPVAYARYEATPHTLSRKCSCCGSRLKYVSVVEHAPTGEFFQVGKDCARGIACLSRSVSAIEGASVALAQRLECSRREAAFRAQNPGACEALDWAATGINKKAADLRQKLRKFGALSEKQTEFLVKLHASDKAAREAATGSAVSGRQEITGTVVSVKQVWSDYTREYKSKALVVQDNGVKLYGNIPDSISDAASLAGQKVTFTANVEPSDKDPLFGFFSRLSGLRDASAPAPVKPKKAPLSKEEKAARAKVAIKKGNRSRNVSFFLADLPARFIQNGTNITLEKDAEVKCDHSGELCVIPAGTILRLFHGTAPGVGRRGHRVEVLGRADSEIFPENFGIPFYSQFFKKQPAQSLAQEALA